MVRLKTKKNSRFWPKKLFFLFFLILFFLASIFLFKQFKSSFFALLGKANFAIVGESQVMVFSYQGKESNLILLTSANKIPVPRGFGEYELGKVYPLGELENKGGRLLVETLQHSLNLPVMGYFYSPDLTFDNFTKVNDFNQLVLKAMSRKVKTDLKTRALVVIYFQTKKLSNNFFQKKPFDPEKADQLFKDEQIRQEAISIEILNATPNQGLAQKAATLWENLGGRVVRVSDYPQNLVKSKLIVRGKTKDSYSYKILRTFFKAEEEPNFDETNRAEISLILGEDYWKIMAEKW